MSRRDDIDDTLDRLLSRGDNYASGRRNADSHLGVNMDVSTVMRGVNVSWLSQTFDMNPQTIKRRLRDCPVLHRRKEGFIYDLKIAVAYLIEPVFNIDEYMKTAKIEDLPVRLQKEFWEAKTKRRNYEADAGDLWRTEQIMDVFADAFQAVKYTTSLWLAEMDRERGVSTEDRAFFKIRIETLQTTMFAKLIEISKNPKTKSILREELDEEDAQEAAQAEIQEEHRRHRDRAAYISEAI
jgi:hypothetical protein